MIPSQAKKAVKVSYQGETKRLKVSADYSELLERTRTAFKNLPQSYKFFYLDEDNEIISISSQSDFTEALDIEDLSSLRLTIAGNVADARSQLLVHLEEQRPLAESLNQSQIMSARSAFDRQSSVPKDIFMAGESDFDAISHHELAQSIFERRPTVPHLPNVAHEIAVGTDAAMHESISIGTDVMPSAVARETGCNTARVMTSEKMIDTCVQMCDMSSQVKTNMQDQGCDGLVPQTQNEASQMEVQVKDADVTCDLLVPSDEDDAEGLEELACFKCNGSQVNKKGLPCRKCKGRGTIVSRELTDLASVIRQEVEEYCYTSFRKMFEEYLELKNEKQDNIVHEKVVCDGCEANPIRGIRYMCSVCADTDFCQKCVSNGVHNQHPLLKVRKPEQAPHKLICQYLPKGRTQQDGMAMANLLAGQNLQIDPDNHAWDRQPAQQKQARYSARFVKESFPDKHEIICNDVFCKSWWMRNDGETAWPAGTQLVQTSGDDIKAKVITIPAEVPAGTTFEFSVPCQAPEKEGRYTTFFRLQTGRIKFGHKVNCDIMCVHPNVIAPEEAVEADAVSEILAAPTTIKAPQPVAMISQDFTISAVDKEMAEPELRLCEDEPVSTEAASESQPSSALMNSFISIDAKTPKQLYYEQVEAVQDPVLQEALKNLYESGFTDFKVNKALMLKLKDINAVANQLLTGALSESQFDAIIE